MLWNIIKLVSFALSLYGAYRLCQRYKRFRHFFLRQIYLLLKPVNFISAIWSKIERRFKRPAWNITGECLKCGQCCELIAMRLPLLLKYQGWFKNMTKWYYEENFSMTFEGFVEDDWMVFSCSHLDNNTCGIYHRRPRICREYPASDSDTKPDIPASCGFKLID